MSSGFLAHRPSLLRQPSAWVAFAHQRAQALAQRLKSWYPFRAGARGPVPWGRQRRGTRLFEVEGVGRFCLEWRPYDVIKEFLRSGRAWEEHLHPYLKTYARPGTTVVDVGAHIGSHTLMLSRLVGDRGRVVAFEPQAKLFQELLGNLWLNERRNVRAEFCALGSEEAFATMQAPARPNEGGTGLGSGGNLVAVRTLDSFSLDGVSLIKIDVEGHELEVLRGARRTIEENQPTLILEIGGGFCYESAPPEVRLSIDSTRGYLDRIGYSSERLSEHDYLALPRPLD